MKRKILGKYHRTDDTPWRKIAVRFVRDTISFVDDTIYPSDVVVCRVDEDAELKDCWLWCNEEGEPESTYTYYCGRDAFKFSLPYGDGSPIQLGVVLAGSNPVEASPPTLLNYIDDALNDVSAGETDVMYSDSYISIQPLSALRIINLSSLTYADPSNISDAFASLGFTHLAVNTGAVFKTISQGLFSDSSWNWQMNKPIFLGANGTLTQTFTENAFIKTIATPITPQQIFIKFEDSILIA
jgi:hypothetical protein